MEAYRAGESAHDGTETTRSIWWCREKISRLKSCGGEGPWSPWLTDLFFCDSVRIALFGSLPAAALGMRRERAFTVEEPQSWRRKDRLAMAVAVSGSPGIGSRSIAVCVNFNEGAARCGAHCLKPPQATTMYYKLHIAGVVLEPFFDLCLAERCTATCCARADRIDLLTVSPPAKCHHPTSKLPPSLAGSRNPGAAKEVGLLKTAMEPS